MLEGLVTWVLNNYVGEYLENLNADQLSIALLQGQVELENVPIKKTALRKFDIPLQVKSGLIGKLTLSIPITRMRSEPWILKMSDLLILLGPSDGIFDASNVEGYEQSKKEQLLEALESHHRTQLLLNKGIPMKDEATQNQYWGASLVSAVSHNIQLILSNVHIRYEDSTTMPNNIPFHFGIRIQHISIQTTNSLWKAEFVQPSEGVNTFKKLDIKGFSVFWNCDQEIHKELLTHAELKNVLSPESSKENQFILQPFSMQARMEKNSSKFPLKTMPAIPRFRFDLRPEKINIEITKKQLAQIRVLTREWARFDRARQHRKWRPIVGVKENARMWWKFAINRVRDETMKNRERCSLNFLLTRATHLNQYCKAYKQKLEAYIADQQSANTSSNERRNSAGHPIPTSAAAVEDVAFMKQIEHDSQFSYHELHLFRETIFRRLMREKDEKRKEAKGSSDDERSTPEAFEVVTPTLEDKALGEVDINPEQTQGLYGWISSWFGSDKSNEEKHEENDINEATFLQMWPNIENKDLPPNLKRIERKVEEEILDVLNESWDDSTVLRRDNLLAEIVLKLERIIIRFIDEDSSCGSSRVIAMDWRQVASRVQLSPREHRTEISLSVGEMNVHRLKIDSLIDNSSSAEKDVNLEGFAGAEDSAGEEDDPLILGFGSFPKFTPQLLFAIGRAKEEGNENENSERFHDNLVLMSEGKYKTKKPLFQMIYRRMAPRLNVLHELDAKFSAISVIYDEDAFDGISTLFDTEAALLENALNQANNDLGNLGSVGETQCYMNFSIPAVLFELRSRRTSLANKETEELSSPFACAKLTNVDVGISKTEPLLTRLKISLSSLIVDDLYEKNSTVPLIKTVESRKTLATCSNLSNSCPDLHEDQPHFTTLSSSLPTKLEFRPVFMQKPPQLPLATRLPPRDKDAPTVVIDNDFGVHTPEGPILNFVFVDSEHPEYESKYAKRNCIVDAEFNNVDFTINRRTFTMLLDFFGALGVKKEVVENVMEDLVAGAFDEKDLKLLYGNTENIPDMFKHDPTKVLPSPSIAKKKKEDFMFHLKFAVSAARIFMTYPKNQTQLGIILLNSAALDVKINLKDVHQPMILKILASELFIHDATPFYSRFYTERLALKSSKNETSKKHLDDSRKLQVDIVKYRTDDPNLKRKCDMKVNVIVEEGCHLHYIHTHRFFCAVMDFWMNFAELQDQVRRTNENIAFPEEQQKTRALLNIEMRGGASLILPLNQFSDQIMLWETSNISITNRFQLGSQTPELHEQSVENKIESYNCLLEKMEIKLSKISIHEGYRISVDQEADAEIKKSFSREIGHGNFQNYFFAVQKTGILTRKCDLNVNVYRNLSGLISHNAPDLVILTKFENIDLSFSTDFYCYFRGFLEKNLGDQLIPVPDTIPIEILQNPDRGYTIETVEKYPTFSFRLTFENVQFHFKVPENPRFPRHGKFKKFGRMVLNKARISYDCYVDSLAEFDLICESTELVDTRFEDVEACENENVFPLILGSKEKAKPNEGSFMKLMSEIHIMMKKDEAPTVTLVLQNSRIILIMDWLNNALNFFLLNTQFVPPEEPSAQKGLYGFPKEGILTRTLSDPCSSPLHTITLKITLRESDLILLEKTKDPSSLALVCFTTAVLNLNDQHGIIETNFEVQKLNCAWCMMSSQESTRCQISNDFTAAVLIKRDILPVKDQAQAMIRHGLNDPLPMAELAPRQKIMIELGDLVARISYKDMLVLINVFNGSFERLKHSFENSLIPKRNQLPGKPPFNFQKIFFTADHLCFWFLDDSQGVALPMLRLILSSIQIESHLSENLSSSFQVSVDYFNQQIYGWEPFIEPWKIKHFNIIWKPDYIHLGLKSDSSTPLDINITQTLIQQMKQFHSKWPIHKKDLDRDFRNLCIRSRSDHLPYLLKNDSGSNLLFTTDVEEINMARLQQRKSNAKWFSVATDKSCTFEFPTKRLIAKEKNNDPRQMIIRVAEWDEISPVDVDSVGTYFRLTKASSTASQHGLGRIRIVVAVTMDADGRKVVTVRSALLAVNQLLDPIILKFCDPSNPKMKGEEIKVQPGGILPIPLKFVNSEMNVRPSLSSGAVNGQVVDWRCAKTSGEIVNQILTFELGTKKQYYWMCLSIKRENYPEHESLSGHSIVFVPPLSLTNLLPVEIEITVQSVQKQCFRIGAGDRSHDHSVDVNNPLYISIRTEHFKTIQPVMLSRSQFLDRTVQDDKRISFPMMDAKNRSLDVYGSVYISRGGSMQISLWVPYWIVNRSGIPLIFKQEATAMDAAGQFDEHEKAKDKHPLMFSFSDENCPEQCVVRVGKYIENDIEYKPEYSNKFTFSSGVQSLKLLLTHEFQATLMYDIGMEVRQCTGKYKNTQVVLFVPRYRLNNQSSSQLFVCHHEDVTRPNQYIPLASKCNLIWHENFEDKRRLCIRRADLPHWSCPFRIDQIGSFHVTMRDSCEEPKFVRVEVSLNSASFCVTFSDAFYFPAPIKIENQSNVPVLYQQASKEHNRFRTICKANSTVDYSWDNLYGEKLLTLQVYENKSYNYDPSTPKRGPPLTYENYFYIQYTPSFVRSQDIKDVETDEHDLVLECRVNGKVVLNKVNHADSSQRQLWKVASDNSLENVGLNHTSKNGERYVLDVLDSNGNALMVMTRNQMRNPTQKWRFTTEGTLACSIKDMVVEVNGRNNVILGKQKSDSVLKSQQFNIQRQKPGSGILNVECLHVGPTLVVRITDHFDTAAPLALPLANAPFGRKSRSSSPASSVLSQRRSRSEQTAQSFNIDGEIHMPSGIGISLVNNTAEELIYAKFHGLQMHFCRVDKTYQITGHVNVIQVDNQLLTTDRWQVLYCQANALKNGDLDSPSFDNMSNSSPLESDNSFPIRPALKLEMNCTPMEHYDAFDCFRVKICDMCLLLDETLLWKLVQFMQHTGASDVISKDSMSQPPNIEPDVNLPGFSGSDGIPLRRCYFGTLDLEVGNVALTVLTVAKNGLTKELQSLKRQFNIKLVSFENALVSLPAFRQFHYFETLRFLIESLSKFYMMELQKQTINIVVTMDAFGNPRGLATDIKESFQGLIFEADVTGFVYGVGYGVTNSLSKVASSVSHGVGSLTFDEQHELMRKRMMRIQPQSENGGSAALSHFCNGVKGFGVGVFGGVTAIAGNVKNTTKKDGIFAGVTKGLFTGAVDTVTKPAQGLFDLIEGTASAVKEVVGSHSSKKSRFSDHRVRLPRVCTNLQFLLPVYSPALAIAQQELLRINGYSTNEILYDVEVILRHQTHDNIEQRVLICSEQCYCLRQINDSPASVTQRIPYRCFKNIFIDSTTDVGKGFICIAVTYDTNQRSMPSPRLVCGDKDTARRLCEKILRAKQLYDHSKRTLARTEDEFDSFQM